ncbi:zinc-ribbon domain-containing protein [uncultured Metabacillus sp.]|uniref:zinc-ribbon domain-containing protein n=1 Tax=uncultured Metabacillus sp. TaxID=2860135 RepID=UPI002619DD45|nr:zinc-ribbon domain-containing protein [uncultured Metabacillus sp.]
MLIEQLIKVKWSNRNKKHFIEKGYSFSKNGDEFLVDVNDLKKGSHYFVRFICDYCNGANQIDEKSKWKKFKDYNYQREIVSKDCCISQECMNKKNRGLVTKRDRYVKHQLTDFQNLINEWSDRNDSHPEDYTFSSPKIVWWKCENNHEWESSIRNRAVNNSKCPHCNDIPLEKCLQTTHPELAKQWNHKKNEGLTPYQVTKGSDKKVWWLGNCGHEWAASVSNRTILGRGCPVCNESNGEKIIRKWLSENMIENEPQKKFDNLLGTSGGLLSYDFYLPKYNILIEYQGEFHDGTARKQNEIEFKKQQEHDKRKREYATKHNIELLEIWYWDIDNIEVILSDKLNDR